MAQTLDSAALTFFAPSSSKVQVLAAHPWLSRLLSADERGNVSLHDYKAGRLLFSFQVALLAELRPDVDGSTDAGSVRSLGFFDPDVE
eukprot:CAMPEP_0172639160 /NCGR_PEP_ID=MMETSP1068-20121228/217222_1 /TAXON_ID=35684 /ORGANISM="Pseudopedinella elastica, Strain CCMP716" /LENGTH=87 /DNA_ID=CAMNT_0013452223 /DNA_START=123 /DNA_END=383 /DNA_ORIENTATION=+